MGRGRCPPARGVGGLKALLDTHFLIWVVVGSQRLEEHGWLDRYRPWGVSPVSFLEIQLLSEIGRIELRGSGFVDRVMEDPRLVVDEVGLVPLIRNALPLDWTRDPFDRLLAAHSAARRVPLCTVDRTLLERHVHLPDELR